jgi:hypothetical protein
MSSNKYRITEINSTVRDSRCLSLVHKSPYVGCLSALQVYSDSSENTVGPEESV